MPKLSSLSGKFNADGKYHLSEYDEYLAKLVKNTVAVQDNIKKIAKELHAVVMKEEKWYDDSAVEFALWWNNIKGVSGDGVDRLNAISTTVEELVRITAIDVCREIKKSKQLGKSYTKYAKISKFANATDQYVLGIENINKKKIGNITPTKCREGATLVANGQALMPMVNRISTAFDKIDAQLDSIHKIIERYLIQGKAINFKGLNSSVLKTKMKNAKRHMVEISEVLYQKLSADQNATNETSKKIKAALEKDYYVLGNVALGNGSKGPESVMSDFDHQV
ncbi:MAG: hypothetical protein HFJ34_06725 [Clostridia bacterium]|nr:hypothetical protein [Clostridia bacterium]